MGVTTDPAGAPGSRRSRGESQPVMARVGTAEASLHQQRLNCQQYGLPKEPLGSGSRLGAVKSPNSALRAGQEPDGKCPMSSRGILVLGRCNYYTIGRVRLSQSAAALPR
jgi:hypothetical protein